MLRISPRLFAGGVERKPPYVRPPFPSQDQNSARENDGLEYSSSSSKSSSKIKDKIPSRKLFDSDDAVSNTLALDILRSFRTIHNGKLNHKCFRNITTGDGPSYKLPAIWNLDEAGIFDASLSDDNIRDNMVPKMCRKILFDPFNSVDVPGIRKNRFDIPTRKTMVNRLKKFLKDNDAGKEIDVLQSAGGFGILDAVLKPNDENTINTPPTSRNVSNTTPAFVTYQLSDLIEARGFLRTQASLFKNSSQIVFGDNIILEVTTGYIGTLSTKTGLWKHIAEMSGKDGFRFEDEILKDSVLGEGGGKGFVADPKINLNAGSATTHTALENSNPPHKEGTDPFVHVFCYNARFFNASVEKAYRVVGRDLNFFCKNKKNLQTMGDEIFNGKEYNVDGIGITSRKNEKRKTSRRIPLADPQWDLNLKGVSEPIQPEITKIDESQIANEKANHLRHSTTDSNSKKALSDVNCEIWSKSKFAAQLGNKHERFGTSEKDLNPHYSGVVKEFPLLMPGEEWVCGNAIVFDLTRAMRPNIYDLKDKLGTMEKIIEEEEKDVNLTEAERRRKIVEKRNNKKSLRKRINESNSKLHKAKSSLISKFKTSTKPPNWSDLSFHMSGGFHVMEEACYTDSNRVKRDLTRPEKLENMKFEQLRYRGDTLANDPDLTIADRAKTYEFANLGPKLARQKFFWMPISNLDWRGREIDSKATFGKLGKESDLLDNFLEEYESCFTDESGIDTLAGFGRVVKKPGSSTNNSNSGPQQLRDSADDSIGLEQEQKMRVYEHLTPVLPVRDAPQIYLEAASTVPRKTKFWSCEVDFAGHRIIRRFGRLGTKTKRHVTQHESLDAAIKFYRAKVEEKKNNGYEDVGSQKRDAHFQKMWEEDIGYGPADEFLFEIVDELNEEMKNKRTPNAFFNNEIAKASVKFDTKVRTIDLDGLVFANKIEEEAENLELFAEKSGGIDRLLFDGSLKFEGTIVTEDEDDEASPNNSTDVFSVENENDDDDHPDSLSPEEIARLDEYLKTKTATGARRSKSTFASRNDPSLQDPPKNDSEHKPDSNMNSQQTPTSAKKPIIAKKRIRTRKQRSRKPRLPTIAELRNEKLEAYSHLLEQNDPNRSPGSGGGKSGKNGPKYILRNEHGSFLVGEEDGQLVFYDLGSVLDKYFPGEALRKEDEPDDDEDE